MPEFPSLEEVLSQLADLAEVRAVDPDTALEDLDVESLDLLEWVYDIGDRYSIEVDESIFDGVDGLTLRDVYGRVRDLHLATA